MANFKHALDTKLQLYDYIVFKKRSVDCTTCCENTLARNYQKIWAGVNNRNYETYTQLKFRPSSDVMQTRNLFAVYFIPRPSAFNSQYDIIN